MDKFCRYCIKHLPIDNFEDGLKTCKKCLEYKEGTTTDIKIKHKETNIKKIKNIGKKIHNYRDKVAFCNVCNSSMRAQCHSRHLTTNKHKRNL